jgi:hypothetical protein
MNFQVDLSTQLLIISISIPVYSAFVIGAFVVPDPKSVSNKGLAIIASIFFVLEVAFSIVTKSWTLFWGALVINIVSALVALFWSGKLFRSISLEKRTNKIIAKLSEEIINSLEDSDIGIVAVASDTATAKIDKTVIEKKQKINNLIEDGIRTILSSIKDLFLSEKFNLNTQESILIPTKEGKFSVLSHNGLTKDIIDDLEKELSFAPSTNGLAGVALATGVDVVIPDLLSKTNELTAKWVTLGNQKKEGSIFCIVIKAGVGGQVSSIPLAVFCITSGKLNNDQAINVYHVASRFVNKIKILIYFLMMLDTMASHHVGN